MFFSVAMARAVLLVLMLGMPTAAQLQDSNNVAQVRQRPETLDEPFDPQLELRWIKKLNESRQKSMVQDAEKLVRLARELNDAVAQNGSPMSDQERLRRVGEIEKLAKDVKNKMMFAPRPEPVPYYSPPAAR